MNGPADVSEVWWLDEDHAKYRAWQMELTFSGVECRVFPDESSLVSALATQRPGLLILDLMCNPGNAPDEGDLPKGWNWQPTPNSGLDSGLLLARQLSQQTPYANVPVVILTGTSDNRYEKQERPANIVGWIYKHDLSSPSDFSAEIARYLEQDPPSETHRSTTPVVDILFEGLIHDTHGSLHSLAAGLSAVADQGSPSNDELSRLASLGTEIVDTFERYRWMYEPPTFRDLTQPPVRVRDLSRFVRGVRRSMLRELHRASAERSGRLSISPSGLQTLLAEANRPFAPSTMLHVQWKAECLELRFEGSLDINPHPLVTPVMAHLQQHFHITCDSADRAETNTHAEIVAEIPWTT